MKRKILSLVALILAFGMLMTGCGGAGSKNNGESSKAKTGEVKETVKETPKPVKIVIWHDKGDAGINFIKDLDAEYKKINPNVTIESISYPTDQWIDKSAAALNTNSAPDILFNDATRIITIQQNTKKIADLKDIVKDNKFINSSDLQSVNYDGKVLGVPFQRVLAAMGVRKSWMDKVGGKFPETWAEFIDLAKKFTSQDPDGNNKNDTYGFTVQGKGIFAHETLALGMMNIKDYLMTDDGKPAIASKELVDFVKEYAKLFHEYKVVPEDCATHGFAEMYQVIEGSKAGMFRVGNWNTAKWDDLFKGDYVVGPWPKFRATDKNNVVLTGTRCWAVPENAPNKQQAMELCKFLYELEPQKLSFKYFGTAVRNDLNVQMSPAMQAFSKAGLNINAGNRFLVEGKYKYVDKVKELTEKAMNEIITNPKADVEKTLKKAEEDITKIVNEAK